MDKRRRENAAFLLPPYMPLIITRTVDNGVKPREVYERYPASIDCGCGDWGIFRRWAKRTRHFERWAEGIKKLSD
jgi:hypothetical protein